MTKTPNVSAMKLNMAGNQLVKMEKESKPHWLYNSLMPMVAFLSSVFDFGLILIENLHIIT